MAKNAMMDALRRLKIQNGDVLVVSPSAITKDGVDDLAKRLSAMGKRDILIVVLPDPDSIRVMNETMMNSYGWFRARNIIPLRNKIEQEGDKNGNDMEKNTNRARRLVHNNRG